MPLQQPAVQYALSGPAPVASQVGLSIKAVIGLYLQPTLSCFIACGAFDLQLLLPFISNGIAAPDKQLNTVVAMCSM